MEAVLPLATRYGAAVVVLALDDAGHPRRRRTVALAVVERVRARRRTRAGLTDDDLVVDCLVMTAATDRRRGRRRHARSRRRGPCVTGLATVLGVSNVSHGLPGRPELNAAMLAMARDRGPRCGDREPRRRRTVAVTPRSRRTCCSAATRSAESVDRRAAGADAAARARRLRRGGRRSRGGEPRPRGSWRAATRTAVERGDADAAPALVDELIAGGHDPRAIIADVLTPAIQRLGDAYGRGEVFLPQLMVAAEAMKAAVARVKMHLPEWREHVARAASCSPP